MVSNTPINSLLPEELNELFNGSAYEEDNHEAGILIESVKYVNDNLHLTFSIRFPYGTAPEQSWQITVTDIKNEKIVRNWTGDIQMYSEHILLLEYTDIHTELYFKGVTENHEALFIEIFQALCQLPGTVVNISRYLFSPGYIKVLSQQGYGLFARGTKTILDIYAQCLLAQGIKPIFIGKYEPETKNDSLKLLTIGDSHFIGRSFIFERIK